MASAKVHSATAVTTAAWVVVWDKSVEGVPAPRVWDIKPTEDSLVRLSGISMDSDEIPVDADELFDWYDPQSCITKIEIKADSSDGSFTFRPHASA